MISAWTPAATPPIVPRAPLTDLLVLTIACPPAGVNVCFSRCHLCCFRVVIDGETAAVVPRTITSEIHRYKANATDKRTQTRPTPQGR